MMKVPHSSRSVTTNLAACFPSVVAHRLSPTYLIPSNPTALYLSFCLRLRKIPGTRVVSFSICQSLQTVSFFSDRRVRTLSLILRQFSNFRLWGLFFFFVFFLFSLLLLGMESWRKQHGEGHHLVGHWSGSSSFYNRKPPLEIWQPTVPRWEKMFCSTIGSVPWGKLVETKKYMHLHGNVMNWDDSAGREAFHDAKSRFWAAMNGLPCNVPLPDPNIYIDDINWNSSVDPELILDLERDATVPNEEKKDEEVVILGDPFLLNQPFCYTGWGEAEADAPKHIDSCSGALVNLHENTREGPWEQHHSPDEAAKVYEWKNCRNGSWGWNQREHHHTDAYKMGKRIGGWNRGTWNWFKRNGENMSWNKGSAYHYGNRYQKNRGRKNYKGNRVTFTYDRPCVEKKQTYCYVNEDDTEGKGP